MRTFFIKIKKHLRRKGFWVIFSLLFSTFLLSSLAFATTGVPKILNFQGRLLNSSGALLGGASGTNYCYRFSIYNAVSAGSKIWPAGTPTTMTILTREGVFDAQIGGAGGDALTLPFTDDQAFVQVEVAAQISGSCSGVSFDTMSPRQQIVSSAYAITSGTTLTNANLTGAVTSVGNATSLGSFSSANLSGALTDETGSGAAVFGTSPTFTTSVILPATIDVTGAATTFKLKSNTASALVINDGTNAYQTIDTRTTNSGSSAFTFTQTAPTIASASGEQYISSTFTPGTYNVTGTTNITGTGTASNLGLLVNQPTMAGNGTLTITEASNLLVNGAVKASSSSGTQTITNSYGLNILAGSALNGTGGAVTNGYGLSVNAPTGASNNYAAIFQGGNVGIGTTSPQATLSVAGNAVFGVGDVGTPTATTVRGAAASGTNIAGANLTFDASNGTGTGGSGAFLFRTASPAASGSSADTLTERFKIASLGNVDINGGQDGSVQSWSTAGNALPAVRTEHAVVVANGYIYVIAGRDTTTKNTTVYYAKLNADGSPGSWTTSSNALGTAVADHSSVTSNGYIYSMGGLTGAGKGGESAVNTVNYAKLNSDGSTGVWSVTSILPSVLAWHSSVVANGYIYVIGGSNNGLVSGAQSTVYYAKLNANGTTGVWQTNGNALTANSLKNSPVVANGYLYVIGGYNGTSVQSTVYYAKLNSDGSTGTWTTNANALPAAREWGTSYVSNGYVYVVGGDDGTNAQSTVYYAKLNSDGSTGTWTTNTNALPAVRSASYAVSANGYLYVAGGSNTTGLAGAQSTVYYASTMRIRIAANLDLLGLSGQTLTDTAGDASSSLYAGSIYAANNLEVANNAMFWHGVSVNGPLSVQDLQPGSVSAATGQNAGAALTVTGAAGGTSTAATGTGGIGGALSLNGGTGGIASGATSATGGVGGSITLTAGNGGSPTGAATAGGVGGIVELLGGNAGSSGNINGGNIYITGGAPSGTGTAGNIILGETSGNAIRGSIGIGTTTPRRKLDVLDGSGASQFRLSYSDNSVYNDFAVNSAGLLTISSTAGGGLSITPVAGTSGSPTLFSITGPAHTSLAASTEANDINFNLARTVQFAAGALTTQRAVYIQAPTYGFVGASTLTTAATLDISGAPQSATNATITNSYGLNIEAGAVQPAGTVTNAYGLSVNAPTGAGSNYAAIFQGGNVGIGTTSPGNILQVTGSPASGTATAKIANTLGGTTQNNGLLVLAGNNTGVNASQMITFQRTDATVIGSISQNAAATVAYNTSSDIRIKDNVTPTAFGLSDLLKINVSDFTFISDINKQKITGFIAQNLYSIFPGAVTTNGDNGTDPLKPGMMPWMVDYSKLTPLLVKSVQDLNLNLEGVTGTVTPLAGSASESFVAAFFKNVESKIGTWLADATNGVVKLFAGEVHTGKICVKKSDGTEFCANGDDLQRMVNSDGSSSMINNIPAPAEQAGAAAQTSSTTTPAPVFTESKMSTSTTTTTTPPPTTSTSNTSPSSGDSTASTPAATSSPAPTPTQNP